MGWKIILFIVLGLCTLIVKIIFKKNYALEKPYLLNPTLPKPQKIPGTPSFVPIETDCMIRGVAYDYGKQLIPSRNGFKSLYDALCLQNCPGIVKNIPYQDDEWKPPKNTFQEEILPDDITASVLILYVDSKKGKDSHSGSRDRPLLTLYTALDRVAKARASTSQIIIREGTYFILPNKPLLLSKLHNNLSIRNYPNEKVVITGAYRTKIGKHNWNFVSRSYIHGYTIWSTQLNSIAKFDGLRLGSQRWVRAKTPNGSPESSQHNFESSVTDQLFGNDGKYKKGWFPSGPDVKWIRLQKEDESNTEKPPPIKVDTIESNPHDWSNVYWPKFTPNENTGNSVEKLFEGIPGAGGHGPFLLAAHGTCSKLTPPVGYFCSKSPPRGDEFTFRSPEGMVVSGSKSVELNEDAIVVAWRGGSKGAPLGNPRWFNWIWKVSSWQDLTGGRTEILFDKSVGGNQGAQGSDAGDYFYIENIKSGLDEPTEYYFDSKTSELFIVMNGTWSKPTGNEDWGFVQSKELIKIYGSQKDPVKNLVISGIQFRDTALTWLDPHATPTGGDWSITKMAAIASHGGLDGFTISNCLFERLDGSAILLDGYHRNVLIEKSEFSWLGASAIISWGRNSNCLNSLCTRKVVIDGFVEGPDGRGGQQPRGTRIIGNLFREIGVFEKQSAAYFSALSGKSLIESNVMFNAPRAFINFNDGFLGGDIIKENLIFNAVRESADHGPINLWDRVPYIWEGVETFLGSGGTVVPLSRRFERNFIIANHASQSAIDSDDGASWIQTKDNVFVYGGLGLKSDFGGHHHESIQDLYFYTQWFCFLPIPKLISQSAPLNLVFRNNTCIVGGTLSEFAYGSKCSPGKTPVEVGLNRVIWKHGPLRACEDQLLSDILKRHPERDPETVELSHFPKDEVVDQWIRSVLLM